MRPPGEQLPREHHLKRRSEFLQAQREGERVHTRHYLIVVIARPEGPCRLGITTTKKVATAVGRNRIKRVLREVFRRNRDLFPEACDVVVIAKSGAAELGYEACLAELARARRALTAAARKARPSQAR